MFLPHLLSTTNKGTAGSLTPRFYIFNGVKKIKTFGDKSDFFKIENGVLSSWDWSHKNLNRYSMYFEKHKNLFEYFDTKIYEEFLELEKDFTKIWCDFISAENLLIRRASGYDSTFYFKKEIKDLNNSWGYSRVRVKFNHVDLQTDMNNLRAFCDYKRADIYSGLSIDFLKIHQIDENIINVDDKRNSALLELKQMIK